VKTLLTIPLSCIPGQGWEVEVRSKEGDSGPWDETKGAKVKVSMKCDVLVVSEETRSWEGKKGRVDVLSLAVLDQEKTPGCRFKQTFDFEMGVEEKGKYLGKLVDKRITIGITDLTVFGGRFRAQGTIVSVLDK